VNLRGHAHGLDGRMVECAGRRASRRPSPTVACSATTVGLPEPKSRVARFWLVLFICEREDMDDLSLTEVFVRYV